MPSSGDSANRTCTIMSVCRPTSTWLGKAASTRRSEVIGSAGRTVGAPNVDSEDRISIADENRSAGSSAIARTSAALNTKPTGGWIRCAGTSGSGRPFLIAIDRCTAVGGGVPVAR